MSGFIISLSALTQGRSRLEERSAPGDLGLPPTEWQGEVQGAFDLERSGEQLAVHGRLYAVARLECARCLREFDQRLDVELTVFADRSGTSRRFEKELERDHYMKFHDGRRLDLRQDAREALLLELPITPRCGEHCRGLCPRCGSDLNAGPCRCPGSS